MFSDHLIGIYTERSYMRRINRIVKKLTLCMVIFLLGVIFFDRQAQADVIWEPEDSFYKTHSGECEYINRLYTANGPDGNVVAYKSPENSGIVGTYDNGTEIRITHTYEDKRGVMWGIYENGNRTGWIPMDYLKPVYDYICFQEEFGEEIVDEAGALDKKYNGLQVYFWYAPGSEKGNTRILNGYMPEYTKTYVDELGRKWGFTIYYMGTRNMWFCLDDPQADFETLWKDDAPELGANTEEIEFGGDRIVPGGSSSGGLTQSVAISVILVVLVMVITLYLLRKLKNEAGM